MLVTLLIGALANTSGVEEAAVGLQGPAVGGPCAMCMHAQQPLLFFSKIPWCFWDGDQGPKVT
jgi:hypothetical protein